MTYPVVVVNCGTAGGAPVVTDSATEASVIAAQVAANAAADAAALAAYVASMDPAANPGDLSTGDLDGTDDVQAEDGD